VPPTADRTRTPARRERPELERDLLTVLTLAYEPVSRTEWTRLANEAGLRLNGKAISTQQMADYCERLADEGALIEEPTSRTQLVYFTIPPQGLRYLEEAAARDRLAPLHEAVQRAKGFTADESWRYSWGPQRWYRYGTELRVAVALSDHARANKALRAAGGYTETRSARFEIATWIIATLGGDPSAFPMELLGDDYASDYVDVLLNGATKALGSPTPAVLELAAADPARRVDLARHLCVRGQTTEAVAIALPKAGKHATRVLAAFFEGDQRGVIEAGSAAIEAMGKRRKYRQLKGLAGLCHALCRVAVAHEEPAEWEALGRSIEHARAAKAGFPIAYRALAVFHRCVRTGSEPRHLELDEACRFWDDDGWHVAPWPSVLAAGLVYVWLEQSDRRVLARAKEWLARAETGGCDRLAQELSALAVALDGETPPEDTLAAAYRERETWQVALDTLDGLATRLSTAATTEPTRAVGKHVVWEVSLGERAVAIQPRLVSGPRAKRGKPVSLTKMLEGKVAGVSDRDRSVLALVDHVDVDPWARRPKKKPELRERALLGLVDHPHVVRKGGTPLRISKGEPSLRVEAEGDSLIVSIEPRRLAHADIAHAEQSHNHVIVFERSAALEQIAQAIGGSLRLPSQASERLGKILASLGSAVQVSAAADIEIAGEERPADSRIVAQLRWDGTALHVRLRVAPLGLDGPYVRPGEGGVVVAATLDGQPLRTHRDLPAERAHLRALLDACPVLSELPEHHGERDSGDILAAMEVLLELQHAGDAVTLAWPRGAQLRAPELRGAAHARVRIREASDWLTVDVQLPVDEHRVLGFRDLLERRRGRFVELGEGRFIALTEDLQRRIDALEGLGRVQKKGLVASPVVLPLIDELTEGADVTLDAKAKDRLEGLERAAQLRPRVPRRFEAELRDYQREGFTWMARLAEAGLGACLADDMGLGKTVQTLALLVSRQKHGPAIVVAPTSVASNWIDETERFAPSLTAHALASASDRAALLERLGPGDVLVCSYGLLVTEAERLAELAFDTVAFDEAHLLKNARTKRARAAGALSARFRISLTGTPIENHLGELWSLMQATVPGLLGSEKHFERRFATPIRDGNRDRARQLRALLRPFLLRRTKAQVLDELPPRTEVTVRVTPTAAERAFYEALRRNALAQLEEAETGAKGRLQILAQITRLRQAAVDPRLLEDDGPAGAKMDALIERLLALRNEGHRALVFSQFLGAMEHARRRLEQADIPFLSLDGSTSAKERARLIAAFQQGEADVFLMSLKAGGVGVNLTGADYVIHLDPWWNPAVEDQATGRSHRIGQQRPVTVYRLVTEGTIEDKILALHRDKRQLAQDLLGQMDRASRLDVDELRMLL